MNASVKWKDLVEVQNKATQQEGSPPHEPQLRSSYVENLEKGDMKIFISYSWANKEAVLLLKDVLDAHQLPSWRDEDMMHVGDQLFEEIDDGISNATVFIACVSDAYATSVNCRRELQLAVERKKIILPVLVGEMGVWPPRGPMAPLLAGKLYIDVVGEKLAKNCQSLVETAKCAC